MAAIEKTSLRARGTVATVLQGQLPFGDRPVAAADLPRGVGPRSARGGGARGGSLREPSSTVREPTESSGKVRPTASVRFRASGTAMPVAAPRRKIVLADLPDHGHLTAAAPQAGVTTESLPRRSSVAFEALGTVFVFVMFFAAAALV